MIRPARPGDVPAVVALVRELARYERAAHEVRLTEQALADALFREHPAVSCHVADVDGETVGFALWFLTFSTWLGRHGIYLEDLYVRPSGAPRRRPRPGAAGVPRPYLRRTRVRPPRVVGARLEHTGPRVLPPPRRGAHGRLDGLADDR